MDEIELEELRNTIKQWNVTRLDLFAISEPDEVSLQIFVY